VEERRSGGVGEWGRCGEVERWSGGLEIVAVCGVGFFYDQIIDPITIISFPFKGLHQAEQAVFKFEGVRIERFEVRAYGSIASCQTRSCW
jgi:hypothetical protein